MKTLLIFFTVIFVKTSIAQTPQWELLGLENEAINDIVIDDSGNVYVGCISGVFKSTDNGSTWISKNNGLEDVLGVQKLFVDYAGNILLAGIGMFHDGLYKSIDGAENWVLIVDTLGVSINQFDDITVIPNEPGGFIYVSNNRDGVFRSMDNGITWQFTNYSNPGASYIGINTSSFMFFANNTASWYGIYRSTDLGLTWVRQTLLGAKALVYLRDGSVLGCCYDINFGTYGIYQTTDNGNNWMNTNPISSLSTDFVLDSNDDLYVSSDVVYISTDGGYIWSEYGLSGPAAECLAIDSGGYIWAGTFFSGIYRTTGRTVPVELLTFTAKVIENNVNLKWVTVTETNNQGFEIFRSAKNNINEWKKIGYIAGNGTTTETRTYSFVDEKLIPGTYQYRLKQIDFDGSFEYSDIIDVTIVIPNKFELYQNFPNPFNPSTTIKFSIDTDAIISIDLYNMIGEKIISIIQEENFSAGIHEIEFGSEDISSGIYLYSLKSGSFVETKKMILLK